MHRGQKAIYLCQLELILTDNGEKRRPLEGDFKQSKSGSFLGTCLGCSRLCPDF